MWSSIWTVDFVGVPTPSVATGTGAQRAIALPSPNGTIHFGYFNNAGEWKTN